MKTELIYRDFKGTIESEEDDWVGPYYGKVLETGGYFVGYQGGTLEELRDNFEVAVDDFLEFLNQRATRGAS